MQGTLSPSGAPPAAQSMVQVNEDGKLPEKPELVRWDSPLTLLCTGGSRGPGRPSFFVPPELLGGAAVSAFLVVNGNPGSPATALILAVSGFHQS